MVKMLRVLVSNNTLFTSFVDPVFELFKYVLGDGGCVALRDFLDSSEEKKEDIIECLQKMVIICREKCPNIDVYCKRELVRLAQSGFFEAEYLEVSRVDPHMFDWVEDDGSVVVYARLYEAGDETGDETGDKYIERSIAANSWLIVVATAAISHRKPMVKFTGRPAIMGSCE